MISTLNLDFDWKIEVEHKFQGKFLGQHAVMLKIGEPGKKIDAVLDVKNARKLAEEILKFLPDDHDFNPEGFRQSLIGQSFKKLWNEAGQSTLRDIAHKHGLMWEQIGHCEEYTDESKQAREGDDECYLNLIHEGDKIADTVWG